MNKKFLSIFITFSALAFCLAPLNVFADGGIFTYDPDMAIWNYQDMKEQLCMINYENGTENMILSIDVDNLQGEKAVWIFPVPAKPLETKIDIIKGFPRLSGYDIKIKAKKNISNFFTLIRATQIYAIPEILWSTSLGTTRGKLESPVLLYESIEKMGLTTELIATENERALYDYLTSKGVNLSFDFKEILKEYMGKDYSFVVSWISDIETFKKEQKEIKISYETINKLGVSVSFPTEKIYFPLKPTSIYGDKIIPILVYVIGHVTPENYPEVAQKDKYGEKNSLLAKMAFANPEKQIGYFIQNNFKAPSGLSSFFNNKTEIDNLKYTKIKLNMPSGQLTEDLWIKNSAPSNISLVEFLNRNFFFGGLALFALISCLSSMIAGIIIFKNDKPSKIKFALFGLTNFLTLIGFAIIAYFLKIDKKFTQQKQEISEKPKDKKLIKKCFIVSLIISGLPVFLISLSMWPFLFDRSFVTPIEFLITIGYILAGWAALFLIIYLFSRLIILGHRINKKIRNFILSFTIIFLSASIVFQIILTNLIF